MIRLFPFQAIKKTNNIFDFVAIQPVNKQLGEVRRNAMSQTLRFGVFINKHQA